MATDGDARERAVTLAVTLADAVDSLASTWPLPSDEAAFRRALTDAWLAGRSAAFREALAEMARHDAD